MTYDDFGLLGALAKPLWDIVSAFSEVLKFITEVSIGEVLNEVPLISSIVATELLPQSILDIKLIVGILGSGLFVYIGYQLLTWVLNVVT